MLALIFGGGVIAVKKLGAVKHTCLPALCCVSVKGLAGGS